MKVRVTLSVDIDVEKWDEDYGDRVWPNRVEDVRAHVLVAAQNCAAAETGAIKSVELRS